MTVRNRQKMHESLVESSTAHTVTVTLSKVLDLTGFQNLRLNLKVSAVSGTTPTLDVSVIAFGEAVADIFTIGTVAQITATGNVTALIDVRGVRFAKIVYTIAGTSPSFTVELTTGSE